MEFKVPQNVQREDNIVGPLTLKQLIILAVGGGITYAIYVTLSTRYYATVWAVPVLILSGITMSFAFIKIYGRPFHIFLINLLEYNLLPRKRIWIKGADTPQADSSIPVVTNKKTGVSENSTKKDPKSLAELAKILNQQQNGGQK